MPRQRRTATVVAAVVGLLALSRPAAADGPRPAQDDTAAPGAALRKPAKSPSNWLDQFKDIAFGPGKLSTDLSVRSRYEHYGNYNVKKFGTDENDPLLLLRTRLGLEYRLNKPAKGSAARFYLQFQDARHWLSDLDRQDFTPTCPHFDQLDIRQAYVDWQKIAGTPLGLKLGRQSICYADKRIFGPGDWGNVGRYWWDAAKVTLDTDIAQVDFLYGQRIIQETVSRDERHFDFDMLGAYARIKNLPFKLHGFYVLRYNDHGDVQGEDGPGDHRRHSVGLHADGKRDGWDFGGTLVGQFGKKGADEICAFGGNARLGYTFDAPWKPRLGAEFTYASGDDDPNDGRCGTFDGVFGAIDSLYGRMNLFSWMNLEDYQLSAGIQPCKGLKLSADYHLFRLASDNDGWYWCNGKPARHVPGGGAARTVGSEIDLLAKWEISDHWALFVGYAHFFPGPFVDNSKGNHDDADWVFAQVTFSF